MNYHQLAGKMNESKEVFYINLIEQYHAAGISPWNNTWGNIHDFTTIPDSKNYLLLDQVKFLKEIC